MQHFFVGRNSLTGGRILLKPKDLLAHQVVVGGTRRGKSKLAEAEIRHLIKNGRGLLMLDPHGHLYHDLLAFATSYRYKNRVILINPNDPDYSVGLNFLQPNGQDPPTQASGIIKAIFKVFGEDQSQETKPRLERWLRNLLIAFIEGGSPLSDALDFLSVSNCQPRDIILRRTNNPYVLSEWEQFQAIKKRSDKENLIESVLNRAAKLILSDQIRRILGQVHSTIDIESIVETGKVVLVNLQPLTTSREAMQILGILLVDQFVNYGITRTKLQGKARPFFVFVDEASELCSNDLPYALQALGKYGLWFRLFFQNLEMIRKQSLPGYFDNVMSNCDTKIAFKTSYKDAQDLIGDFFAGEITGDNIKLDIQRYDILPRESARQVRTVTEAHTHTESESETEGTVDTEGESSASGSGTGSLSGSGFGESALFMPEDWGPDRQLNSGKSSFYSSGASNFSSSSFGSSTMHGETHSTSKGSALSKGRSVSRTTVPFYEYLIQQNLGSRQYYSIEEIKEKFISWMMCQPQRHAQLKIGDRPPVPIITSYVREERPRQKDIRQVIAHSNQCHALPTRIVDKMIEERRRMLLSVPEKHEDENDRWESV